MITLHYIGEVWSCDIHIPKREGMVFGVIPLDMLDGATMRQPLDDGYAVSVRDMVLEVKAK